MGDPDLEQDLEGGRQTRRLTSGAGNYIDARVSTDGQVVFATVTWDFNVWSLPLDANRGMVTGGLGAPHSGRKLATGAVPFARWQDSGVCRQRSHQA